MCVNVCLRGDLAAMHLDGRWWININFIFLGFQQPAYCVRSLPMKWVSSEQWTTIIRCLWCTVHSFHFILFFPLSYFVFILSSHNERNWSSHLGFILVLCSYQSCFGFVLFYVCVVSVGCDLVPWVNEWASEWPCARVRISMTATTFIDKWNEYD